MKHITTFATLLALMSISSAAWACGGSASTFVIGLFVAPFLAVPYTLFGTAVIASQARSWFNRPLLGWMGSTLGAWMFCTFGGIVGFGLSGLTDCVGVDSGNLEAALIFSTPFVFQVAYLMWLHSRRPAEDSGLV